MYATCSLLSEENESVRRWFDERFGDEFVPMPFERREFVPMPFERREFVPMPFERRPPSAPDVAGDVDEGDAGEGDAGEDGCAMDDGAARSHDFALRPDLHGCDGFYVARWVRERGPGWDP